MFKRKERKKEEKKEKKKKKRKKEKEKTTTPGNKKDRGKINKIPTVGNGVRASSMEIEMEFVLSRLPGGTPYTPPPFFFISFF